MAVPPPTDNLIVWSPTVPSRVAVSTTRAAFCPSWMYSGFTERVMKTGSVMVISAELTGRAPDAPETMIVSSSSVTSSSTGVMVSVPSALVCPLGMVILARLVAV